MNNFIDDFTKPIERSDRAHAEYVPTQVVTGYFRHVYRTGGGAQLATRNSRWDEPSATGKAVEWSNHRQAA